MVDGNDLDNFLTDSTGGQNSVADNNLQNMPRPKLKKIKRPKIRPQLGESLVPMQVATASESDLSSNIIDEPVADITKENDAVDMVTGTELMTSVAAQNVARENVQRAPYVLGGLPPDLDFGRDVPEEFDDSSFVKKNTVYSIAAACLVIGIVLGFLIAPKGTEQHGLEDVAWNDDTPTGRVRCGKTDPSQACTFYVLNSFKRELTGRDFYKLAAQMTGREEFMIETENMQYSTTKIKPGFFAQLNIPALR